MSSPFLAPSRPASQSSIRETTSRSTSPSGPLPLPLHPANARAERENDENDDPFTTSAAAPTTKPNAQTTSLPFEKPASSGIPRKPRLSVTGANPAAKDIIHRGVGAGAGHLKRLSTGSLRGEHVDAGARVENLEVRVRNYKMDCIGLAKDILGLCEENAASKAWIREIAVALDSVCKESKDGRERVEQLVGVYEQIKAQVQDLHALKAENGAMRSTLEWQSLILQDLLEEKKQREKEDRTRASREDQLESQVRALLAHDEERRAEIEHLAAVVEQHASARQDGGGADASLATVGSDMMQALLTRIAELERSFADTTLRLESAPLISPALAVPESKRSSKSSADLGEDDRKERDLARQLEKGRREAKDKEARMQALLGEALERNLVLAARVRELETNKTAAAVAAEATTAFGLAPVAGAGASIADTLFPAQTPAAPRGRHSHGHSQAAKEAQTPAPTLPELDPMSPFVLDRTVKRGERRALGIAQGRSSNLRE